MSGILSAAKGTKVWVPNGKLPDMPGEIVSEGAFWKKSQFRCQVKVQWFDLAGVEHETVIAVPIDKLKERAV